MDKEEEEDEEEEDDEESPQAPPVVEEVSEELESEEGAVGGIVARVRQSQEYYDPGARQKHTQPAARETRKDAQLKWARDDEMLLNDIMIAGSLKHRKTETEQGWPLRLWNEAKQQTEDAREAWVAQVAQVTAPTGA